MSQLGSPEQTFSLRQLGNAGCDGGVLLRVSLGPLPTDSGEKVASEIRGFSKLDAKSIDESNCHVYRAQQFARDLSWTDVFNTSDPKCTLRIALPLSMIPAPRWPRQLNK